MPPTQPSAAKKWLVGEFSLRRLLRSMVEIYFFLLVIAFFFADRFIFHPPRPTYSEGNGISKIPVNDQEQIGLLSLPHKQAGYTILYFHGNAEDLGEIRPFLEEFQYKGFSVYASDYRGYGISSGKASSKNAREDGEAAFAHLVDEKRIEPQQIILYGRSLGAAVAIDVASKHQTAGLAIESGFLTAFRSKTQIPLFPFDRLRNDRLIRHVTCPVMISHGQKDVIIPGWQGKRLYARANNPKLFREVSNAGHNDLYSADETGFWESWDAFIKLIASQRAAPE